MKKKIFMCLLALAVVASMAGMSQGYPLTAALNSMQVAPSNNSTARGSCKIDSHWGDFGAHFDLNCDFIGLSGPLIDADVRYAWPGQNGEGICLGRQVMVSLPNTGSGNVSITCASDHWFNSWTTKYYYVVLQTANFPDGEIRGQIKPATLDSDVDGDGLTDAFLYRPSDASSYALCSINNKTMEQQFAGLTTDSKPFLADFDGDGIADHSFTRINSKSGMMTTIYVQSRDNTVREVQWGNADLGDQTTFGDYDADRKIDVAVFRPSEGIWHILQSSNNQQRYEYWGRTNDKACPGDYDKDGKTDLCVVRDENGQLVWHIRRSSDNLTLAVNWGLSTDTIFPDSPVDVDADGANDILVSRDETGQRVYYALRSSNNTLFVLPWGLSSDKIKIGDYDGDGKTDFAALREVNDQLVWFVRQSSNGQMRLFYWGLPGDV